MRYIGLYSLKFLSVLVLIQSFFLVTLAQEIIIKPTSGNDGYIKLDKLDVSLSVHDKNGEQVYRFGGWGLDSEYSFDRPVHLSTQSGLKIFVTDAGQKNVKAFDKRLQPIAIYNVDDITPVASVLVDKEQLLVIDKSLQKWLIIDTRFNIKKIIKIRLEEHLEIDADNKPLLTNSWVIIPVKKSIKNRENIDSLTYNYLSYSRLGEFKSWLLLPDSISTYSLDDTPLKIATLDKKLFSIELSQGNAALIEPSIDINKAIVWVSATEYGYLKNDRLIIEKITTQWE